MLEVKKVNLKYGAIHALKDINFKVNSGEIVTLIGANGAGKSSTLRAISGLVPIEEGGSIEFKGRRIDNLPAHKIVSLGIIQVLEGRRIFPGLSVADILELGAYVRKDKEGIKKDLEWVFQLFPRLKERRKQIAGSLSGGEQQMLAMGRGLMSRPELMLLDEPSMGLAPLLVREIFDVIKEINSKGTTILLVEQNANMALSIANRGYVLETGSIVLEGEARALAENEQVKRAYLGG